MPKKNGGFSLIEMIVSVAILSVVTAAAVGFMVSGANSFSSVSGNVNLQVRSQLTMNNIQEKIIDCNYGIDFDDGSDTLYIVNLNPSGPVYTADIYKFIDGAIYYGNHICTLDTGMLKCSSAAPDLLAKGVSSFSVGYPDTLEPLTGVLVEIGFQERNRSFLGSQTTALRNSPLKVNVTPIT